MRFVSARPRADRPEQLGGMSGGSGEMPRGQGEAGRRQLLQRCGVQQRRGRGSGSP